MPCVSHVVRRVRSRRRRAGRRRVHPRGGVRFFHRIVASGASSPADAHADDADVRRSAAQKHSRRSHQRGGDRRRRGDDGAGARARAHLVPRGTRVRRRRVAPTRESHDGHGARAGDVRDAGREWDGRVVVFVERVDGVRIGIFDERDKLGGRGAAGAGAQTRGTRRRRGSGGFDPRCVDTGWDLLHRWVRDMRGDRGERWFGRDDGVESADANRRRRARRRGGRRNWRCVLERSARRDVLRARVRWTRRSFYRWSW